MDIRRSPIVPTQPIPTISHSPSHTPHCCPSPRHRPRNAGQSFATLVECSAACSCAPQHTRHGSTEPDLDGWLGPTPRWKHLSDKAGCFVAPLPNLRLVGAGCQVVTSSSGQGESATIQSMLAMVSKDCILEVCGKYASGRSHTSWVPIWHERLDANQKQPYKEGTQSKTESSILRPILCRRHVTGQRIVQGVFHSYQKVVKPFLPCMVPVYKDTVESGRPA